MSTQHILSTTTIMTSPASGHSFDDVYEQLQAECPTCRGTGRISKAEVEDIDTPLQRSSRKSEFAAVDKSICKRIKEEMKKMRITQEVFAAVACNRTQGLLSDLLKKVETETPVNRSTYQNVLQIEEFLNKPMKERRQLYLQYKQRPKTKHRLNKEYYEDILDTPRREVINSHAKGVMEHFFNQVSQSPDKVAVHVMAETLGLSKAVVLKFFKTLQEANSSNTQDMENESVTDSKGADN